MAPGASLIHMRGARRYATYSSGPKVVISDIIEYQHERTLIGSDCTLVGGDMLSRYKEWNKESKEQKIKAVKPEGQSWSG